MNFVLGVLNKKGEEEVSNKIYFVLKEGTTNDSVIHPINLEEPIGGGMIQNYHRKWTEIATDSLVIITTNQCNSKTLFSGI